MNSATNLCERPSFRRLVTFCGVLVTCVGLYVPQAASANCPDADTSKLGFKLVYDDGAEEEVRFRNPRKQGDVLFALVISKSTDKKDPKIKNTEFATLNGVFVLKHQINYSVGDHSAFEYNWAVPAELDSAFPLKTGFKKTYALAFYDVYAYKTVNKKHEVSVGKVSTLMIGACRYEVIRIDTNIVNLQDGSSEAVIEYYAPALMWSISQQSGGETTKAISIQLLSGR